MLNRWVNSVQTENQLRSLNLVFTTNNMAFGAIPRIANFVWPFNFLNILFLEGRQKSRPDYINLS